MPVQLTNAFYLVLREPIPCADTTHSRILSCLKGNHLILEFLENLIGISIFILVTKNPGKGLGFLF